MKKEINAMNMMSENHMKNDKTLNKNILFI